MKKKVLIWFCSIFALLVAFGLSHRFIISFGIESYLTSHLPKGEKISLSYQDLRFSDRMMVLQDVTLDRKGEAGFHIEVEHLTVAFDWGLSPLFFTPRVVIDHPHVALFDRAVKEKRQDKGLYQTLDKLLLRTPVEIHEGEISFGDEKILFSFVNELEEGGGSLRLQQVAEETPIEIQFRKKENQLQFDVSFHEVKIPWLFKIFQFYHPHFDANYLVSGGTLNGEGSLTLSSPRHIDHISYNFVLSEFLAEQKTYGLELSIDQLGWKEHFTSNEEMEGLVAHPFFDKIWPYFIGEGEIKGLHAALHDPKGEKTWIAADVNGSLRFSQTNEPLVELHGLFHQGEGEAPFHLLGNGIIEDTCFWKLAFDLHLLTEEELKLFFSFAAKGDHSYQMDVEYQNIGAPQIALLKHLIAPHFQPIEKVQVQEGTFQGKGSGWIEKKKLERIAISSFQVENLSCGMKDEQCVFHSLKIEGKGDFDLTSDDFFDGTEWELSVENGKLAFPNQETIKGIDLHLAMHDLYLKPSKLSCEVDGNQASFSFEGLYTHLNIQGDLLLDSKGLKHLVRGTCPLQLKEKRLPLHCALRLNTNGDRLGVDGMVSLVEEGNHSPILFGWNWPVEKLKQGEIFSGIELGWFGGENISAEAINLPLSLLGRDFYLEGTLCLEGTFNGRAIEMSIDPTHLVYHSEALSIVHGAGGQEKVPNCTFYYNFCQGIWRGKIPLKGARVNEHHFGIDFKTFTSEVSLEGTEFIFQNVDAIADGVHFQAEMAVDFSFDDRSELKIDTYSIEGEAEDILQFLKHFSLFQEVDLALKGKVFSGPGGMHLRAYVGEGEELLEWKIGLNLSEGQYPFSSSFGFDELAGEFYYCAEEKLFKIIEVEGTLHLTAGEKPKTYQLNVPVLHYDALEGVINYDCRL
ncbi:MAG: hypothetical protein KDK60_01910, partial [Chlamydiia bacterium]|nr:hypothetical protein [Chlamydiia bacterium]